MGNSKQHYEALLADRYLWLMGGMEANVEHYKRLFHRLELTPGSQAMLLIWALASGFKAFLWPEWATRSLPLTRAWPCST